MLRRRHLLTAVALPLLSHAAPASAWNGTGHETVALIAWDQLTPPQRAAVPPPCEPTRGTRRT